MEKVWLDIWEVSYETQRENDKNLQISQNFNFNLFRRKISNIKR